MSEHKIEQIEWLDSVGSNGWEFPQDAEPSKIISIGWVTAESKTGLTITNHIQKDFALQHHADLTIPKCAITKRKVIKS